jgi:holliday junction DNA helicase RuvA
MITELAGRIAELNDASLVLNIGGVYYEIHVLKTVLEDMRDKAVGDEVRIVIYHYVQTDPSKSIPMLLGFRNKIEREFFIKFTSVSGIGPKAALRALSVPISQIAQAIDATDVAFLKTLPGVGEQRAREIIAKLQGKVGRFGLIQDSKAVVSRHKTDDADEEAFSVLTQLQYKRDEARQMIQRARRCNSKIKSVEDLLNEVYRQRSAPVEA